VSIKPLQIDPNIRLLYALVEELKLPLMQVARSAEFGRLMNDRDQYRRIEITAEAAIKLLDSYVLSSQTLIDQGQLELNSIPLTSTMYDSAQNLSRLTKLYNTEIEIRVEGKCGLVMANKNALEAALTSLAYTFISANDFPTKKLITLFARKEQDVVGVGILSSGSLISKKTLASARKLYGNARQPASSMTHSSGVGLYVADSLFYAMNSELQYSRHNKKSGLLARLLPSAQLSLL
jgi:K+-sensing histidine kinase KdpD